MANSLRLGRCEKLYSRVGLRLRSLKNRGLAKRGRWTNIDVKTLELLFGSYNHTYFPSRTASTKYFDLVVFRQLPLELECLKPVLFCTEHLVLDKRSLL